MSSRSDKALLRAALLSQRRALSKTDRKQKSLDIATRLLGSSLYQQTRSLQVYLSKKEEVGTAALLDWAHRDAKQIALPFISNQRSELQFARLVSLDAQYFEPGPFGVTQPKSRGAERLSVEDIALWCLPGVGFDLNGGRLGYGGGFYDRCLAGHDKIFIGLAFECQIVDHLPLEPTDIAVHYVVTEDRLIDCGTMKSLD